jgi:hypothetical protein
VCSVLDGDQMLDTVSALPVVDDRGPVYRVEVPGETETENVPTGDWAAAIEYGIAAALAKGFPRDHPRADRQTGVG